MQWSFGIITDGTAKPRIDRIIASIRREPIKEYEIIIVGGEPWAAHKDVVHIPFDEAAYPPQHITKKKNLITAASKFENVCYLHDYLELCPGWYSGFQTFGNDWKICMTRMANLHGQRFRDWTLEPLAGLVKDSYSCLLPYDVTDLSRYQYISGAYWCAKKNIMQEIPQDERRHWGSAEDIEWSRRANLKYDFSMNPHSEVHLLKEKGVVFGPASPDHIAYLRREKPQRGRFVWQDLNLP